MMRDRKKNLPVGHLLLWFLLSIAPMGCNVQDMGSSPTSMPSLTAPSLASTESRAGGVGDADSFFGGESASQNDVTCREKASNDRSSLEAAIRYHVDLDPTRSFHEASIGFFEGTPGTEAQLTREVPVFAVALTEADGVRTYHIPAFELRVVMADTSLGMQRHPATIYANVDQRVIRTELVCTVHQ